MGRVVTFAQLPAEKLAGGVARAPVTEGDTREMAAEFIHIPAGGQWRATAPRGADCYLFMLGGAGAIAAGGSRHRLPAHAFATVQEGVAFTVESEGGAGADIVQVVAPPQPGSPSVAGFTGTIAVAERAKAPTIDLPNERKKRIYFVDEAATRSQRGHAMIVIYQKDTVTGLHHHPNADSMFVVLDGALAFTVNGEQVVVKPGQAAYFGCNDRHGLRVADGLSGASFLEFHIPAAYTTVRA